MIYCTVDTLLLRALPGCCFVVPSFCGRWDWRMLFCTSLEAGGAAAVQLSQVMKQLTCVVLRIPCYITCPNPNSINQSSSVASKNSDSRSPRYTCLHAHKTHSRVPRERGPQYDSSEPPRRAQPRTVLTTALFILGRSTYPKDSVMVCGQQPGIIYSVSTVLFPVQPLRPVRVLWMYYRCEGKIVWDCSFRKDSRDRNRCLLVWAVHWSP